MLINKVIKVILLMPVIFLITACSTKIEYIKNGTKIYTKRAEIEKFNTTPYPRTMTLKEYQRKTKNLKFDGYNVEFLDVNPYFNFGGQGNISHQVIGSIPKISWARKQGFIKRSKYRDKYTFMLFTLNQEPFDKKLLPFFNTLNTSYVNRLNPKDINKFVKYSCDKNIVFSKYERDENYKPLVPTCYAKRLDKDVFLITRFAHPNTKEDKKIFQTKIIPTILKSIKLTPIKLSPWEYY